MFLAMAVRVFAGEIGTWQVFPSYHTATRNVTAGNVVYSLMGRNLMSYNTVDSEVRLYDNTNTLSDRDISLIDYSSEAKRLIIVYANNNIDLLDANDNVLNLSALKDKSIIGKNITDIYMDGSKALLSTGFGFMEVDLKEGTFADSYRLGLSASAITQSDSHVFLATTTGIYRCDKSKNMHQRDNWELVRDTSDIQKIAWFEDRLYAVNAKGFMVMRDDDGTIETRYGGVFTYLHTVNDELRWSSGMYLYSKAKGSPVNSIAQQNTWKDVSYGNGTYWVSDGESGLRGYKLKEGKYEAVTSPIQPNSPKNDLSYRLRWVGDRLLVSGGINTNEGIRNTPTAMMYEDGKWTNFEELTNPDPTTYPNILLANTTDILQDPSDDTHHYASLHRNGIAEYRNCKFDTLWNCNNSPLQSILSLSKRKLNYVSCSSLQYDQQNNIWMTNSENDTIIRIWKADGKWEALYYEEIAGAQLCDRFLMHSSGMVMLNCRSMTNNSGHKGFFVLDTNGTLSNTRDDKHKLITTIVNQDETTYSPDYFYSMTEDLDGRVWVGTDLGLFVMSDPTEAFKSNFRFTQIKINRNDGSGLADYLLSGVSITCVAVDGANRKWIGTQASGVFLVSADGQETLHHFTSEDSPLPSDFVQDIAVNPLTGEVMIATDGGLCSYMSDAIEAAGTLEKDNVVCFPNPVASDYTGPVVVKGLTYDSEVKIFSTGGQLVWSGRSLGGQFTWNGCNKAGRRVASGVYHVVANNSEGKKAIVTRIVMVK